ncbi:NAD(P)/FAD-dependent oxidoreductase [Sulfitobacter sp.]|uniref:NAD(P)/FAD-dependent oxidoreductase n=1 Tax=Sulfitobacter sp. TaxID=1903071 RepID=UPI003002E952
MLRRPKLLLRGALLMADLMLGCVPILWAHAVTSVTGEHAVSAVELQAVDHAWAPQGAAQRFEVDSLCLGHGLIPAIKTAQLAGAKIRHDPALGGWVPVVKTDGSTDVAGLYLCGDGAGIRGADAAEIQGTLAGLRGASDLGAEGLAEEMRVLTRAHGERSSFRRAMTALSIPRSGMAQWSTAQTITCRCENLTRAEIEAEISAGATSTNAVKSGLRAGMGPCGGKFCQTAIAQMIASQTDCALGDIPPPTPRPPLRPVPVSAMSKGFDYDDLPIPKPAPL